MTHTYFDEKYDSEGLTPFSWRFGKYLRWHPIFDFLYEVRRDGQLIWASCLGFSKDEVTAVRPAHAAILFYLLNKNHPFANGNKRIALTALLVFLFLNGKWVVAGQDELYRFAISSRRLRPFCKAISRTSSPRARALTNRQYTNQYRPDGTPSHPSLSARLTFAA